MGKSKKKIDMHIWVTPETNLDIQHHAKASQQSISETTEQLIQQALDQERLARFEQSLANVRAALREEFEAAAEKMFSQMRADIIAITGKQTDRIMGLLVRAGKATSLAWRMTYLMAQKRYGDAQAREWYEQSREGAAKAMQTKLDEGKESHL